MMNSTAITILLSFTFSLAATSLNAAVATGSFIGLNFNDWRKPTDTWLVAGGATLSDSGGGRLTSVAGTGVFINGPDGHTAHLVTTKEFGDLELHIEWMVAKGSNSGVYFMGRYEVQVLDSFGKAVANFDDAGGIYQRWDPKRGEGKEGYEGIPPKVNAAKPAGEWQIYDIQFQAPQFDKTGKKTANAKFLKVTHNGIVVQENVEVTGPTRAAMWEYEPEKPTGPLMLQGDHGPVAYRNLTLKWVATKADLQRK